jgi:hypothetical protein
MSAPRLALAAVAAARGTALTPSLARSSTIVKVSAGGQTLVVLRHSFP